MKAPNKFVEALLNQQFEMAKQLLLGGVNINEAYGESQWTALHYAVEEMILETATWLLKNGADPNLKDATGWTPLHLAIDAEADRARQEYTEQGKVPLTAELTTLLLQNGADPNIRTGDGETALVLARSVGHSVAAEILERHSSV